MVHFHLLFLLLFNCYLFFLLFFFSFCGREGGGIEVASNFVICVYMPRIKEFRNLTITFNSPFKEESHDLMINFH